MTSVQRAAPPLLTLLETHPAPRRLYCNSPQNPACSESEVQALAAATEGWTGSDLACCCREAAMAPLRELAAAGGLLRPPSPQGGRAMAVAGRKQLQCRQALQWATVRPVAFLDFVAAVEFV